MCPACIESTAVIVAGAASTGGMLAVCIGKFNKLFRASLGLFQKTKELMSISSSAAQSAPGEN